MGPPEMPCKPQANSAEGPGTHTHIDRLIDAIRRAVLTARAEGEDDLVERSVIPNVHNVSELIRTSSPVLPGFEDLQVVEACYDLASLRVERLD
jgi:hypothetical protein